MSEITERVERGAALLDEKRPGWWRLVDLGSLDLTCNCHCVAGQLGGFANAMNTLGIGHSAEVASYGFDAYTPDPDLSVAVFGRQVGEEFAALTEAWRDLITSRRAAAEVTT